MNRHFFIAFVIFLNAITVPMWATAATPTSPHSGGIGCAQCHTAQNALGSVYKVSSISTPEAYNNICQSCHSPGNVLAGSKPFIPGDASTIFGKHSTNGQSRFKQTSHRWDGSDINPAAGALPPILPAMTSASAQDAHGAPNLRGRTGNQLACARCHTMHVDPNNNGHLLRSANGQDEMCMDCHRTRNQQSHLSGTHPVGVNYDNAVASDPLKFKTKPENANAVNSSSDLSKRLTSTGNLVCSTCHGVHYSDSRSSTFDGASSAKGRLNYVNLSSGDGYILRTDRRGAKVTVSSNLPDKLNICTNCHAGKKNHNYGDQDIQCSDCHAAHVEYDKDDPNNSKGRNVYLIRRDATKAGVAGKIYFRYTGNQREYKNAEGTGVCQGCHNVPDPGGIYPPEHNGTKAADCNGCHYHNSPAGSFSGACTKCHGVPPTTLAGLASPATNALGGAVGAHGAHYSKGMTCNACHYGYADRTMPNTSIDLGFSINPGTVTGFKGTISSGVFNYDPSLLTASKYTFTGPGARDINLPPNATASTCNVYCHGNTLTPGTVLTPSWTGDSTEVFCDSCHSQDGSAMTMGSHNTHASNTSLNLSCSNCHGNTPTGHMNGSVQWDLSKLTTSPNATYQAVGGLKGRSGETGRIAPSAVYGTCSNILCHGQGAPKWGAKYISGSTFPYSNAQCGKCHSGNAVGDVTALKPFYSTAIPKVTSNTDAKVGAHTSHLASTDSLTINMTCNDCHNVTVLNSTNHMSGSTTIVWGALASNGLTTPSYSNGSCASVYCHGATLTGGTVAGKTPKWNVPFLPASLTSAGCGTCHGFPPATSTHASVQIPVGFPGTVAIGNTCNCHDNINTAGNSYANIFVNKSVHINGKVDASGSCNGCHGYPPSRPGFVGYSTNTGRYFKYAKLQNYTNAGGSHTVAGHISPRAVPQDAWNNCSGCHNSADHLKYLPANVSIDMKKRFNGALQPKYSSNKKPGAQHIAGTCTNISCHFQKTPKW